MGRASSSKKVARAAGTGGGRTAGANRPWGYIGVIALVAIVGVALTVTSRSRYQHQLSAATASAASVAPLVGGPPWHEGYLVDICGHDQKAVVSMSNAYGYTTTGDGVVRIAPKTKAVAGKNATLGVLAKAVGIQLSLSSIQLPGAQRYTNGGNNCGALAGRLYVKQYAYPGAVGTLSSTDPTNIALVDDALVTLAFVPPSQKGSIPAPPATVSSALTKAVSPVTTTTTAPAATTTVPGSSSTTVAGSPSTTVAGSSTTTTGQPRSSSTTRPPTSTTAKG